MKSKKLLNKNIYIERDFSLELICEIHEKVDKLSTQNQLQLLNNINHYLYEQYTIDKSLFDYELTTINNDYYKSFESEDVKSCIKF